MKIYIKKKKQPRKYELNQIEPMKLFTTVEVRTGEEEYQKEGEGLLGHISVTLIQDNNDMPSGDWIVLKDAP